MPEKTAKALKWCRIETHEELSRRQQRRCRIDSFVVRCVHSYTGDRPFKHVKREGLFPLWLGVELAAEPYLRLGGKPLKTIVGNRMGKLVVQFYRRAVSQGAKSRSPTVYSGSTVVAQYSMYGREWDASAD